MLLSTALQILMSCNVAASGISSYVAVHKTFKGSYLFARNSSLIHGVGVPWISDSQSSCLRFGSNAPAIPRFLSMATPSTLNSILYSLSSIEAEHLLILGNDLTVKESTFIAEQVRASKTPAVEMKVRNQQRWSLEEYIEPIIAFILRHAIFEVSLLISDHGNGADFVARMLSYSKAGAWNIASVIVLGPHENDESQILHTHLSASEITIICCEIDSARRVISMLPKIAGLSVMLNEQSLWMVALEDDTAVGKEEMPWEKIIAYCPVASGTLEVKMDTNTQECLQRKKLKRADFYQLWGSKVNGRRLQWHTIDTWQIGGEEEANPNTRLHDLFKNPLNSEIRVAIATYAPGVMTKDLPPGQLCFLGSKLGYRFIDATSNATTPICVYGFAIDVLDALEKELHFEAIIYHVRDSSYGAFNSTSKTWNGIVNEIIQGHADIAINLGLTKKRMEYIEFSPPYISHEYDILYVENDRDGITANAQGIFGPFGSELWASLLGLILLTSIVLWGLDRVSPYGRHHTGVLGFSSKGGPLYTIHHSLTCTWGMFTKGEIVDARPRSLSARITMVVISFVATVAVSIYSANLVAFLVLPDNSIPLSGIRDPKLSDSDLRFKLATVADSSEANFFNSSKDPFVRSIHDRMKPHNVETFAEGVKKLHSGDIDGFFASKTSLFYAISMDRTCSLKTIGVEYIAAGLSFGFAKTLPWKASLLVGISRITANGAVGQMYHRWYHSSSCQKDKSIVSLSFQHLSYAFLFLGGIASLVTALAILFSCIAYARRCSHRYSLENRK